MVLLPFAWRDLVLQRRVILQHWKLFAVMAIAFMPLGNAIFYLGYNFTTAINGGIVITSYSIHYTKLYESMLTLSRSPRMWGSASSRLSMTQNHTQGRYASR